MESITRDRILSLRQKPLFDPMVLRLCIELLISRNKERGIVPQLVTPAVTGAATGVLVELSRFSGSSSSFFGGFVPYHPAFSAGLTGGRRKATERANAVSLAHAARTQSIAMLEKYDEEAGTKSEILINGLGLTAAIATNRLRKGADEMYVALEAHDGLVRTVDLLFERGKWSRELQDQLCQIIAINLILHHRGIQQVPIFAKNFPGACFSAEKLFSLELDTFTLDPSVWKPEYTEAIRLPISREASSVTFTIDGVCEETPEITEQHCIIATSGNPYTEGHRYLAWVMEQIGLSPIHSLEMVHPTKGELTDEDLIRRLETFRGRAPVLVTNRCSFFADKAIAFPRASFAVGTDVAKILLDMVNNPRAEADLETFLRQRTRIYVFPRYTDDGELETLESIRIPSRFKGIFKRIEIAPPPVSSSLMRAAKEGTPAP